MPVVTCPSCQAKVQIEDRDLGYDVECPYCQKIFPAKAPRSSAPPPSRRPDPEKENTQSYGFGDEPLKPKAPRSKGSRYDDDDDEYDRRSRRRPRYDDDYDDEYDDEELIADAKAAVFWPALCSMLVSGLGIGLALLDIVLLVAMPQQAKQGNPFIAQMSDELLIGIRVLAILWEAVIFAGSAQMMRLKSYGFAKAVMIMRIIPFAGFCCIIGFIFGILGVQALSKEEVKEAFELVTKDS